MGFLSDKSELNQDCRTIMHEVKNFVRTMNEEVKTIQSVQSEVRQGNNIVSPASERLVLNI